MAILVVLTRRVALTLLRKMEKRSRNCKGKRGKGKDKAVRLNLKFDVY